jgi:flagellar basal body P-ring formation protein FlgA
MKLSIQLTICAFLIALASPLPAQTIAAAQTIRSKSIITQTDLIVLATIVNGALTDADQVIGMEARTVLYPGRPIRPRDIGPPALVERNQIVTVTYVKGSLFISAEGRALGRGGLGERIRVMNLASRTTLFGTVTASGNIRIAP